MSQCPFCEGKGVDLNHLRQDALLVDCDECKGSGQVPRLVGVWLDDLRIAPEGYITASTARSCIAKLDLLRMAKTVVDHLSVDHDLGDAELVGTGYDVLCWLEEQVVTDETYVPPRLITVHSDNGGARGKMELAIESIRRRSHGR